MKEIDEMFGRMDFDYEIEYMDFERYSFKKVDELDTISGGKYEDGGYVYQAYKDGEPLDVFYLHPWSRTGSYYTEWDYSFETPYRVTKKTKTIEYWG